MNADVCTQPFMKNETLISRVFGSLALQGDTAMEFAGQTFEPDATKAYARFTICHGFPCISAYGTCFHPGTIANSYRSLLHQVVDYDHQLKVYNAVKSAGKEPEIASDKILGFVAAVDFPKTPNGGWKLGMDKTKVPAIEGVMGLFKNAAKAPTVMGEYLSGRHKWTVSIESQFSMLQSGFVVGDAATGTKTQRALMEDQTPKELLDAGFGYVTVESAPEELLNCFNLGKRRVVSTWGKLPVTLMQGGINGTAHKAGVGIVRYGAEREAEIQQILASDPDRLVDCGMENAECGADYFRESIGLMERLVGQIVEG